MMSAKNGYQPVPQEKDSDDDESTVFDQQNSERIRDNNDDDIEEEQIVFIMEDKGHKRKKPYLSNHLFTNRMIVYCVLFLAALLIVTIIGYTIMTLLKKNNLWSPSSNGTVTETPLPGTDQPSVENPTSINWTFEINNGFSELSVLIHDVNGDGVLDVLVDNLTSHFTKGDLDHCPGQNDKCMEKLGYSPCQVRLVALSGIDGTMIWSRWTAFPPFAANCQEDLNRDGKQDCLFAGRVGSFAAIDVHNDKFLWVVDTNITCPSYNYYYPLISKDFDEDGVRDIIVTHGGDPQYSDKEKKRTPGFLVVVSGLTGQQLSDRIYTPDQHETYSSPILYSLSNETDLVLFGSGGETISGSLWAITLDSLQDHVTRFIADRHRQKGKSYVINKVFKSFSCYSDSELLNTRPIHHKGLYSHNKHEEWMNKCPHWSQQVQVIWNKYNLCVYEFVPSGPTGTILSPVVVDINGDHKMDLVVSQFNDHTLLFDAAAGGIKWDHHQLDTQTYSIPAPLYFNNDDTLDLVVRLNKGQWMIYHYSNIGVLDGNNGALLWSMECSYATMSSPVTIRNKKKGHDGMLFIGTGCQKKVGRENRHVPVQETCPRKFLEVERKVCELDNQRVSPRHEDSENEENTLEDGKNIGSGDTIPPQESFLNLDIDFASYIMSDLWEVKNEADTFPDPWNEPEDFIQYYCGFDIDSMTSSVYFLTPELISEKVLPLYTFRPYVFKPSSAVYSSTPRQKHHSSMSGNINGIKKLFENRKNVRCAHILAPILSPGTPAISDLNGDGKLEGIFNILYSQTPSDFSIPQLADIMHPPKIIVQAFTIQDRLKEVYGKTVADNVNFAGYFSLQDQPWLQYMGSRGDGIFVNPRQ